MSLIWDDKASHPVNEHTLLAPANMGGRNILDISARNEAIQMVWLKKYLDFSEARAQWAKVADSLYSHYAPRNEMFSPELKISPFLQQWKSGTTIWQSSLPQDLKELVTLANKCNLRPDVISIDRDVLRQMPIWHHG